jgi:AraC-like DNA-binding protein
VGTLGRRPWRVDRFQSKVPSQSSRESAAVDVLDSLLDVMRPRGVVLGRSRLGAPWGIAFPASPLVYFDFVLDGECWVRAREPPQRIRVRKGEFVLVLDHTPHELGSSPDSRTVPIARLMPRLRKHWRRRPRGPAPRGGAIVLYGTYQFEATLLSALRGLPRIIHVGAEDIGGEAQLKALTDALAQELDRPGAGSQAAIDRLVDLMLVYALRTCLRRPDAASAAWIAGLRDPALGRALQAIHAHPGRDWTVARLAREAGRSRSAFAAAFAAAIGQPPLDYLTRWRMTVATGLLRESALPIAEVAQRVGYRNAYAFATAFKRVTGASPGAARRSNARK